MRAIVQRVSSASVRDRGSGAAAEIERGLVVLLGVAPEDDEDRAHRLAERTAALRVFPDSAGKMNLDVRAAGGSVLVVPNFTVCADTSHGNRPSFTTAAPPERAEPLFASYAEALRGGGVAVLTGWFGADMAVEIMNDGPVTVILEVPPGPLVRPS